MAANPLGTFLYAVNAFSFNISEYMINSPSGNLTGIAGSPFAGGSTQFSTPFAAAVEPSGRFLYVGNAGSNNVSGFQIDPVAGSLTAFSSGSPVAPGFASFALAAAPNWEMAVFRLSISRHQVLVAYRYKP